MATTTTSGMSTSNGSLPIKKDSTTKSPNVGDLTANYKNAQGPRSATNNGA